jgi:uncharacterized protein (TIGR04222 family)
MNQIWNDDEIALWEKIKAFQIDDTPHAVLDFQARLARENGWSLAFAGRVIDEYRRFLFLCLRAGHQVTPSEEVDQVWHLHLVYTRSYWERLCGDVFGKTIHHHPTIGGMAEGDKFRNSYQKTLESYERFFGESPPEDIWPPVERRFSPRDHQWVDVSKNWVLPRPGWLSRCSRWLWPVQKWGLTAMVLLAALPLTSCVSEVLDYDGPSFLGLYLALFPVAFLLSWILGREMRAEGAFQEREIIKDAYATAFLGGGQTRQFQALLAKLYSEKLIELKPSAKGAPEIRRTLGLGNGGTLSLLEGRVLSAIPTDQFTSISKVAQSLTPVFQAEKEKLISAGWLLSGSERLKLQFWLALPILSLGLLGFVKIVIGLDRQKPIGYLFALVIVTLVLMVVRVIFVARRSKGGDRLWKELQAIEAPKMRSQMGSQSPGEVVPMLPLAIALLGPAALAQADDYKTLHHVLKHQSVNGNSSSSSGGCGSGCGGGSGSNGCGGGGGCGGCGGGD